MSLSINGFCGNNYGAYRKLPAAKTTQPNTFAPTNQSGILDGGYSQSPFEKDSVLVDGKIYNVQTERNGYNYEREYVEIDGKKHYVEDVPDMSTCDGTKKAVVIDGKAYSVKDSSQLEVELFFKNAINSVMKKKDEQ